MIDTLVAFVNVPTPSLAPVAIFPTITHPREFVLFVASAALQLCPPGIVGAVLELFREATAIRTSPDIWVPSVAVLVPVYVSMYPISGDGGTYGAPQRANDMRINKRPVSSHPKQLFL